MATRTRTRTTYDFPTTEIGMLTEALAEQTAEGAPEWHLQALRDAIARRTGKRETPAAAPAPAEQSARAARPAAGRDYSKQIKFFESLLTQKVAPAGHSAYRDRVGNNPKTRSEVIDELLDLPSLTPDKQAEFIEMLIVRKFAPGKQDAARATIPTGRAARSQFIDTLLKLTDQPAPGRAVELEEGMYTRDGLVIKVERSKTSQRLYARVLDADTGRFEYVKGAMAGLTSQHRMTLEQAAAYGKLNGHCCRCGKELTNPESIERGIGPVCMGKI